MAVYCITQANSLWDDFVSSFSEHVVESFDDITISNAYSLLKKEVDTKELLRFCITNPAQQLVIFYCPPSLVLNNIEKSEGDLNSVVLDSVGNATELLDFFYKHKKQITLVSLLDLFDPTKLKKVAPSLHSNLRAFDFKLSFDDVVGYLSIKASNDKASRIEYLLNSVSVGGTPSVELMVGLAREDLRAKNEELDLKEKENKRALLDVKSRLAEKNTALVESDKMLRKAEKEYASLSKKLEYEREKLEITVSALQEKLEAANREKEEQKNKASKKLKDSHVLVEELNGKLEIANEEKNELEKALIATQKALEKELANKNKVAENSELKIANLVKNYEEELLSLSRSKEKLEVEKSQRNKDFVTLKVKSDREIDKLGSERKKLEKELKSYQSLYYQLKSELESIKCSTAWKTISPVIKVKDKVMGNLSRLHQEEIIANVGLLYTSELFDAEWYLSTYPDVKSDSIDPAKHYLLYGFKEGRMPSIRFDGDWYFNYYEDVKSSGLNPLIHYLKYGQAEGRKTSHNLLIKS